jgi:glucose-6-phosphate 1-dehydrogenase
MLNAFDFVIFGGAGDLALRKLIPGLYRAHCEGSLPEGARIIPTLRNLQGVVEYHDKVRDAAQKHLNAGEFDAAKWDEYAKRIVPIFVDIAKNDEHWAAMADLLNKGGNKDRVFYLSTPPSVFSVACQHLSENGLITEHARVVVEKPLGYDAVSAEDINSQIAEYFREDAIFRIDHYLGKEAVQNILALRFGNRMFENLWDATTVDHVQITISETVGLEGRASFYDGAGAMRDMVQNHIMQLICMVAMEPPATMTAEHIRAEKVNVVRNLRPLLGDAVKENTVRGHYVAGEMNGKPVPGYLDELGQPSKTETYVAIRANIDTPRWKDVPFYLRTGKRMQARFAEIVVQYKDVEGAYSQLGVVPNRLVIRLQPQETIQVIMEAKDFSSHEMRLRPVVMDVNFNNIYPTVVADAYKRLMLDAAAGDASLFIHRAEVDAAWGWVDPIIQAWQQPENAPQDYPAGSWGPKAADELLAQDGRAWFNLADVVTGDKS